VSATASQPDELDFDPIPISALQHAVYCLRQAALIHLERVWEENQHTAEGRVLHGVSDKPGTRHGRGVRRETALPLASRRLGIAGVADLVEFRAGPEGETAFPVEFKHGKPKAHRADEVQLCAQALCLEEMTGSPVPAGALFYGKTKRRWAVSFDAELRELTETTAARLAEVLATRTTPRAIYKSSLCRACSLLALCLPKATARPARAWRDAMLAALLKDADAR
jgi:CRISPR-associated exonuclease Cas4